MFCPNCGNQIPDNAAFCGKCGTPTNTQPAAQTQPATGAHANGAASAPSTPTPTYSQGGAPVGTSTSNNRVVLIALIAVAAVAVIAIIVGVVTCSGGAGKVDLNSMVSDDAAKTAAVIEKMSAGKIDGTQYYMPNDDMKKLLKDTSSAFGSEKKEMKNLTEEIKKQSPWGVAMRDEDREILSLKDLQNDKDPSLANYVTYRVLEKPTCEDIAKIASEVCSFDKVVVGYSDKGEYYQGYAMKGNNEVVFSISASEYEGVYGITVTAVRLDEVDDEDSYIDTFEDAYNDHDDKKWDEEYIK